MEKKLCRSNSLWRQKRLNEKHIEKQLGHANLPTVILQYPPKFRKQRKELQNCGNYQPCRRFLEEDFAKQIIIECRATPTVSFQTRL